MKIYLLGNIANVQTGPFGSQLHKEDYVEFGTPMVTVEHLGNRAFTKQNLPMISDSDKKRLNKYVLNEGDIVFSRVGSVDRCSYVDNKHLGWMFSGRCLRIRPCNVVYPLYLYYYFCMENTKQFIRNIAVGATMPSINTKLMKDLEVPLPTMEIQQKIASILSALDDKIELNNKINENLELQAQAIFKSWFVDFEPFGGVMPEDWKVGMIKDIIELHDSKRIPLSGSEREKMDKIYPYYGATSCMDYVDNYIFDGKYLLLGEDGTVIDKNGYPILQYVEGKFWVNNHAHIITGKLGYTVEILYLLFKQTNVKHIVTGAVQPKISQANLKKVSVTIPNIKDLDVFNNIIQPIFAMIRKNRNENEKLALLRDILLPKLMNGEIDVSEVKI